MFVRSRKAVGESSHIQMCSWELEQPTGTDFSQSSKPYIVLKLPHNPHTHAMLVFHCLWFTQCSFSIGYGLHSCIFYASGITPTHCFPVVT